MPVIRLDATLAAIPPDMLSVTVAVLALPVTLYVIALPPVVVPVVPAVKEKLVPSTKIFSLAPSTNPETWNTNEVMF